MSIFCCECYPTLECQSASVLCKSNSRSSSRTASMRAVPYTTCYALTTDLNRPGGQLAQPLEQEPGPNWPSVAAIHLTTCAGPPPTHTLESWLRAKLSCLHARPVRREVQYWLLAAERQHPLENRTQRPVVKHWNQSGCSLRPPPSNRQATCAHRPA